MKDILNPFPLLNAIDNFKKGIASESEIKSLKIAFSCLSGFDESGITKEIYESLEINDEEKTKILNLEDK